MKYLFLPILLLIYSDGIAQMASSGCYDGSKVYTNYLGTSNHYGTVHEVYSNANDEYVITIYNNADGTNTPKCDEIVPTGITPTGGNQCWIAASVPPDNSSAGVYWQTKVNITGTYTPCPIEDHIFYLIGLILISGSCFLQKRISA